MSDTQVIPGTPYDASQSNMLRPGVVKCFPTGENLMQRIKFFGNKLLTFQGEALIDYLLLPTTLATFQDLSKEIQAVNMDTVKCIADGKNICPNAAVLQLINEAVPSLDKMAQLMRMYRPLANETSTWFLTLLSKYAAGCPGSKVDKLISMYANFTGMVSSLRFNEGLTEGFKGNLPSDSLYESDSCHGAPTLTIPSWALQGTSLIMIAAGLYLLYRMQNK
jgi:hypothetical protein